MAEILQIGDVLKIGKAYKVEIDNVIQMGQFLEILLQFTQKNSDFKDIYENNFRNHFFGGISDF